MNCCDVEHIEDTVLTGFETDESLPCIKCGHDSMAVSRRTLLFMVKPEFLEALKGTFRFCPDRDCAIVYFDEQGSRVFTVDDLRVTVGVKKSTDPIPLCYCFGFDESHLRQEIALTGTTTIPERVSHLIREGLCACDVRNPSGKCCLGEVNRAAKRLKLEAVKHE